MGKIIRLNLDDPNSTDLQDFKRKIRETYSERVTRFKKHLDYLEETVKSDDVKLASQAIAYLDVLSFEFAEGDLTTFKVCKVMQRDIKKHKGFPVSIHDDAMYIVPITTKEIDQLVQTTMLDDLLGYNGRGIMPY